MMKEFYIEKLIKYLENDYIVKSFDKTEYFILNVYMNIKYDTYFINERIKKQFPTLDIEYHIPSIIIKDNKKYNVDEDPIPEGISFITLKVYK